MKREYVIRGFCVAFLAVIVGCSSSNPPCFKATDAPFHPERTLYPKHPLTQILSITHEPTKDHFTFGEVPQFHVTFSNQSEIVVDLSGAPIGEIRFCPYVSLHILRKDGRDLGYGTDLNVATNVSKILPRESLQIDFPSSEAVAARSKNYRVNPRVLLPGEYQCYFQFWVERRGEPERLLSPLSPLVVLDDGSGDAQISAAVQSARGVAEHLQLIIRADGDNLISLTARNERPEPIYLGHNWTWRSRHVGDGTWNEQGGGLRPGGYLTVPPNETQYLGGASFRDHKPPGKYTIQARYFDYEGHLQKSSNTIKINVR